MSKTLCEWEQDERIKKLKDYREMVKKSKFMCRKCGRVASKKKWLCKPLRLRAK